MPDLHVSIKGIQDAQARNNRRIASLQPRGAFGRAIRDVTARAHRESIYYTHVDTGSLRASHRMEVLSLRGRVYIDPSSINPRTGQRPVVYGYWEHYRGGSHAFYNLALQSVRPYAHSRGLDLRMDIINS